METEAEAREVTTGQAARGRGPGRSPLEPLKKPGPARTRLSASRL